MHWDTTTEQTLCQTTDSFLSPNSARSLKALQIFLVDDFGLGLFDVCLHLLHPLVSSLLQLIDWIEQLLFVHLVKSLLVFLHLLEYPLLVLWHLLLKLLQLLLHLSVLAHSDVIVKFKIVLVICAVSHVRSQRTTRLILNPLKSSSNALVFSLNFSPHFLDQFFSVSDTLLHFDLHYIALVTHCWL